LGGKKYVSDVDSGARVNVMQALRSE